MKIHTNYAISSLIIFVGILASIFFWPQQTTQLIADENKTLLLSPSDLVTVKTEVFDNTVSFSGTLKPWQQALLNAQINAEVRTVYVKAGQAVNAGDLLLDLDSKDVDLRYQQALSAWQSRKLELEQAEQKLSQIKKLHQQNFASRSDLDFAQRQRGIAAAQEESAKAAAEQIKQLQQNTTVVAPFAGRIAERFVDEGQLVSAGTPLIKIIEVSTLELEALLPANDVFTITPGQSVSFTVSGEKQQSYTGIVQRINPQARSDNRRVPVYIEVHNTNDRLLAGMFVQGRVKNSIALSGLSVPLSALQETDDGWQAIMLYDNRLVPIAVGLIAKDMRQGKALVHPIKEGMLSAGDKVLFSPPKPHALLGRLVQISQVN